MSSSSSSSGERSFGLDRDRLHKIEEMANQVLIFQQKQRDLLAKQNTNREALGAFRRGETGNAAQVWMQLGGLGEQFVSYSQPEAKKRLDADKKQLETEIADNRPQVKGAIAKLHEMNPLTAEIPVDVMEMLTRESMIDQAEKKKQKEKEKLEKAAAAATAKQKVNVNRLDYSRFDDLNTDDSSNDGFMSEDSD